MSCSLPRSSQRYSLSRLLHKMQPRKSSPTTRGSTSVRGVQWSVTETIEVRSEGREIRRGIYRDFPTTFPREGLGGDIVAPFRVTSVTRDGVPEPFVLERVIGPSGRGGVRVRIGDPDVLLTPRVYVYSLVYETERWLRFGGATDTLYWNVTGNGWTFPIRFASATVSVPPGVSSSEVSLEAWTGPDGSDLQDASWRWDSGSGDAFFETTQRLAMFEGLTIRAEFPKGVIAPPSPEQEAAWFRLDWWGYLESAFVVGLLVALYCLMWIRIGRDPPSRAIVVRYEPPKGFSSAALGFLMERRYETAQLNAALVSLAIKGALTIERDGRKWRIQVTEDNPQDLAREEERLYKALLGPSRTLTLSGAPNSRLRKAVKAFQKTLENQLEKHYFVTNRNWFLAGAALSLTGFAILVWRARFSVSPEIWFFGLWLTIWTAGVATLLYRVYLSWAQALSGDVLAGLGAVFLTLFAIPFVGAEIFVGLMLYRGAPTHLVAAAIALGGLNILFYHLLERPTVKGRGVLDELEGFRKYLSATEGDELDRLQPPDRSLELFERFLPYAIAMDVSNRWAERFEKALTPTGSGIGTVGRSLTWYATGGNGPADLTGLASSLGDSFSSSLSASSASPSSSGGGGGGGSSGGGGGGGGGGGW